MPGGRLVEQQHLRVEGERERQLQRPLAAVGERAGGHVGALGEPDLGRAARRRAVAEPAQQPVATARTASPARCRACSASSTCSRGGQLAGTGW